MTPEDRAEHQAAVERGDLVQRPCPPPRPACCYRPLDRTIRGPGPGWVHLAGPVWERADGVRVHLGGLIRFPNGHTMTTADAPTERRRADRLQPRSRRRMAMTWAHLVAGRLEATP